MNNSINYGRICGFTVLYVVTVFATAFLGYLAPFCWVGFPVVAALLGAFSYYMVATKWQAFGVSTLLSVVLAGWLLVLDECTLPRCVLMVLAGVLADIVRMMAGNESHDAMTYAYPIQSVGVVAWILPLWTHTTWYHDGAAREMSPDYANGLMAFASPWALVLLILITALAGYIGLRYVASRKSRS